MIVAEACCLLLKRKEDIHPEKGKSMAEKPTSPGQPEMKFSFWRFLVWGTILTILFFYIFGSFSVKERIAIPYSVFNSSCGMCSKEVVFRRRPWKFRGELCWSDSISTHILHSDASLDDAD